MKTKILLVQVKDEEDTNKEFCSVSIPFSSNELQQATRINKLLANESISAIYVSSTILAVNTAKEIVTHKKVPVIATDDLKCIYAGMWQDKSIEEIRNKWSHEWKLWNTTPSLLQFPNGESVDEFQERVIRKVNLLTNQHFGKTICLVVHSITAHLLLSFFKGIEYDKIDFSRRIRKNAITEIIVQNNQFIFNKRIKF